MRISYPPMALSPRSLARQFTKARRVVRSAMPSRSLVRSALALCAALSLPACEAQLPEDEIRLCLRGGVTPQVTARLQGLAERHGLRFDDYGPENKAELESLGADRSIIPTGLASSMLIDDDGEVVMMGGNFGSTGDLLVLSFFNLEGDARRLSFRRDVMDEAVRLPGSTVVARGPDQDGLAKCPK